jgi:hypothetical protein
LEGTANGSGAREDVVAHGGGGDVISRHQSVARFFGSGIEAQQRTVNFRP